MIIKKFVPLSSLASLLFFSLNCGGPQQSRYKRIKTVGSTVGTSPNEGVGANSAGNFPASNNSGNSDQVNSNQGAGNTGQPDADVTPDIADANAPQGTGDDQDPIDSNPDNSPPANEDNPLADGGDVSLDPDQEADVVDANLAQEGLALYQGTCMGCHGFQSLAADTRVNDKDLSSLQSLFQQGHFGLTPNQNQLEALSEAILAL